MFNHKDFENTKVRDILKEGLIFYLKDNVRNCFYNLSFNNIIGAPIIDKENKLVGYTNIFTLGKVVINYPYLTVERFNIGLKNIPICNINNKFVDILLTIKKTFKNGTNISLVDQIPVVDDNFTLKGIILIDDIQKLFSEFCPYLKNYEKIIIRETHEGGNKDIFKRTADGVC